MDEQTDYAWWSDDPSIGYTLCSMSVDPATATVEDIDYITDFPVGTHKPSQLAEAVLYPNPASASAVFSLSQVFSGQLSIYDAGSRLLQEYQIEQTASLNLSLEDLQSGLYVYVLKDTHGFVLYSGKFLVK